MSCARTAIDRGLPRAAALLLVMALCRAAGGQAADEGPVFFRADYLPSPTGTDAINMARREVVQAFRSRHPNYSIEAFSMPRIEGQAMDSGPLMAVAADVPPHAIYVNFRQSSTYIDQGFLEPIEVLLARILFEEDEPALVQWADGGWRADPTPQQVAHAIEQVKRRVPGPAWPVVFRENDDEPEDGRHVWAVPTSGLVMALLYRKDLFFQAGLDPERPPRDWDELLDYARRLTVPERRQYGMMFYSGQVISWSTYTFLVSNGARAVEKTPDGQWRAVFGSREAAEAIYYVWRLAREPFERAGEVIEQAAYTGSGNLSIMWLRGQIGMHFSYLREELLANINPQLVGIAPVPLAPGGTRGSEVNCTMLGVFSRSTPAQKLAVMRYIWFITGDEAKRIRTRTFVENGFGKFVSPNLLREFGYERLLRQVPKGWQEAFDVAMANGVPEPYGRNTQNIYRWMSVPINRALTADFGDVPRERAIDQITGWLQEQASEVNRKVLGAAPPEQMRRRRIYGGASIAVVALVFSAGMWHVWRYFSAVSAPIGGRRRRLRKYAWGYALLAPGLLLVLVWQYLPLVMGGFGIAFMDYRIVRESTWVGVDNFANVLFDAQFWAALGRTCYFLALMIGLGFWPPILLAILLQEVPTDTAKYLYRTIFYLPAVVSGVVVMFLWKQLYDASPDGVLNKLLLSLNWLGPFSATLVKLGLSACWLGLIALLVWLPIKVDEMSRPFKAGLWLLAALFLIGTLWPLLGPLTREGEAFEPLTVLGRLVGRFELTPLKWIEDPALAMLCVVIPFVWAASGPGCIIYLAALKSVPDELYEAADIDGASNWHKVFYIVLPRLKYLIVIQFIAAVVGAFKGGTDYILALTGGGPNEATTILALEIFIRTFMDLRFGLGTAMAWLLGALLIGFTAYQLKMLSRAEFRAAG